jgi:hypothetical protein
LITGARGRFGAATDSRTIDVLAAGLRAGDVFAADVAFAARAGVFVFFAARAGIFFSAVVFLTDVLRAAGFLTGRGDGVLGIAEMSVKEGIEASTLNSPRHCEER